MNQKTKKVCYIAAVLDGQPKLLNMQSLVNHKRLFIPTETEPLFATLAVESGSVSVTTGIMISNAPYPVDCLPLTSLQIVKRYAAYR